METQDIDTVVRTIYGEARGEYAKKDGGLAALIAVANVIHNRFRQGRFGPTHRDICLKPFQFSCWNKDDPNRGILETLKADDPLFQRCKEVAVGVLTQNWPDLTKGSDHYHTQDVFPYWAAKKTVEASIGRHYFYRLGGR